MLYLLSGCLGVWGVWCAFGKVKQDDKMSAQVTFTCVSRVDLWTLNIILLVASLLSTCVNKDIE